MSVLSTEVHHPFWNELSQPLSGNIEELEDHSPGVLAYNSLFENLEDRHTPEFYTHSTKRDPVLLESSLQEEPLLKKFKTPMSSNSESHNWSIDDILAECTPEKTSLWTGAISEEEHFPKEVSHSSFDSPPNYSRLNCDSDVVIDREFGADMSPDLQPQTLADVNVLGSPVDAVRHMNIKAEFQAQKPVVKLNTKIITHSVSALQSPKRLFAKTSTKTVSTNKITKTVASKFRGNRSSKFNHGAKRASLQRLILDLQSRVTYRTTSADGFLVRKSVAKELKIEDQCVVPVLDFVGTLFPHVCQYLGEQAVHFQPSGQFRTIWNYHREQNGSTISMSLTPYNGESSCDGENYQFSVISRVLPHDCFGKPQSLSKKKTNKVQDELEHEKRAAGGSMFQWRHFVTSFEYFKLVSFMLGSNYDYSLNDNQVGETRGSDGKVISPEKRHDMRTRSHAKIYFEGKAVKSAHELMNGETANKRKSFIVGTFGQIMGYTHMKPFGSDSSLSVMEFKYLEEALSKEINFHLFHSV
ncbi:LAME_0D05952g1_1 [Lachancea meyersii CBS 8951]|uniref:LAME_0D05952g1_1 n=1 Tax=Lachancea meyersii CBS 8951 TaxID=1266667 RepID=A0A1G4J924_9SACH|nr:LAME_0D05952g1_1 [Lachancea meyersii CBS 8951]